MIVSGSVRKYFLYAIGEIALVVIGILIALQVNNWNNENADKEREGDYLMALKSDFQQINQEFENNKWEHETVKSGMEQILDWIEEGRVPTNQQPKFDSLLSNVFYRSSFDPPQGTIETILGSGNVALLSNRELVSLLTQWTSIVDNYQSEELRAVDHFYETIYPYLSDRVNMQDMDKSIPTTLRWPHELTDAHELITDQKFHNVIYVHWVIQWNVLDRYALNIDQSIKEILELIDKDLEAI